MNRVFAFSGTGNSQVIASSLASSLGETTCHNIAGWRDGFQGEDEERVGLVFPVFAWGMPRMVAEFARSFRPKPGQYVFAVATCAGTPGKTLVQLDRVLRSNGAALDAGFVVQGEFLISLDPANDMALIRFMSWLGRNHKPALASDRLPEIARAVAAKKHSRPEVSNLSVNVIGSMMYGVSTKMFKTMDKGFSASDACVSCGICSRVCPRENVTLEKGRPAWHQNCEMCYACLSWCPQRAISLQGGTPNEPSHHPDAQLGSMLLR